jgi:hypothetical protein
MSFRMRLVAVDGVHETSIEGEHEIRQAYGLGYACQREDRFSRLQRRAARLNRELGGGGWSTWDSAPSKPKWMRWRTYDRKYERWERAAERANAEFEIRAMRILRRPAVSLRVSRSRRP